MKKFALIYSNRYIQDPLNKKYIDFCHDYFKNLAFIENRSVLNSDIFLENKNTYEGLILFGSEPNDTFNEILHKIVLSFHSQSKPIAAIGSASLNVAIYLKKYTPFIALPELTPVLEQARHLKVHYELCPANDYISDRDCKVLSNISETQFESNLNICLEGLKLIFKEFWEIT